ncbi:MAG: UDP-N-acetylglucosamine 2-epimerase [Caedibacter sp. 38-128]|nr:UDP-N-acetylglucosamine 2-epimerase (non-hydrolyzing) [Holosporales bacterium]OJX04770.1 MAG: UDP-N-acetylglucosamine 2-epimerase [Caedibacter sp. 38-128]
MKTLHLICAARPNFVKIAPLYHALKGEPWCDAKIIHTGQHYDYKMSEVYFKDFALPSPHYSLGVNAGSHAEQTGQTMIAYEKICLKEKPDLVVVVGDVNATLACAITAKKLQLKVAHLEAGLRAFDRSMPEELNRIMTDSICDYHWTPSQDANDNLKREGKHPDQINLVGNIMIDTYCLFKKDILLREKPIQCSKYAVLTLHRPFNADSTERLKTIMAKLSMLQENIIFPAHPRTQKTLTEIALPPNIHITEPMGYIDFMALISKAQYVITDSGGIQEETTYMQIPCYTLRSSTERPITTTIGSNQLVTIDNLLEKIKKPKRGEIPPLWDGKTAFRVRECISKIFWV